MSPEHRNTGLAGHVPLRVHFVKGHPVPEHPEDCEPHTPTPSGYLAWDEWSERMGKTHTQRQCKGCGLWAVWEPKQQRGSGDA